MILLQPEEGIAHQEILDLMPAIIKNVRPPILVFSLPRIGVLVEVCPVELPQRVRVLGEVRRHPIQNDPDPVLVAAIDQCHEIGRAPESARRRKVAGHLVPPRSIEGMLHDGEEFQMGESHFQEIGNKLLRHLVVREESAVFSSSP